MLSSRRSEFRHHSIGDLNGSCEADGSTERLVVRHHDESAVKEFQRLLQLLNGREIQMIGWLIQNQSVDPS